MTALLHEIDLSQPSHYAVLGVDAKNFSEEQLKKNFRLLALKWHPDRNRGSEAEAAERFKQVQTAHACLADAKQRRAYDRSLLAARIAARRAQGVPKRKPPSTPPGKRVTGLHPRPPARNATPSRALWPCWTPAKPALPKKAVMAGPSISG